jgi:subtilisin family serine protease
MRIATFLIALCFSAQMISQTELVHAQDWHHLDVKTDQIAGMSSKKTYETLLEGKEAKRVVVAVLDSGVDIEHEDLDDRIWVNKKEIPDNGIDDDGNGYVDDINGWNFLGNDEEDIQYDNLEFTRIYKALRAKFDGKTTGTIDSSQKEDYERYLKMDEEYKRRLETAMEEYENVKSFQMFLPLAKSTIAAILGKEDYTLEEVEAIEAEDELTMACKEVVISDLVYDLEAEFAEMDRHYSSMFDYAYNLDYDSRAIIGDDYDNLEETGYGNNHVQGPNPDHGTHVAGIIGAERNNGIGMDGICDSVEIMVLRVVPEGDEHDKDIANAIYYAVDNGARIINMSFGKSYSPHKPRVDQAAAYAAEKGVVLIHAAGNSNRNNDNSPNFPNPVDEVTRELCTTWIEVGASAWSVDKELIASFSNYGKQSVDVFAPGHEIYSTVPGNEYGPNSGTSMAAPMVSGLAAMLLSYYPNLTGKDVKEIIVNSYENYGKIKVVKPGSDKTTKFKKLSRTGGIVNCYSAIKMAAEYSASKPRVEGMGNALVD